MKSKQLHSVWSAPDNTRLTSKQSSFRLPVHVAAKLAAIAEMYPTKTRTQIVGDLLSTAIEEWASELPSVKGLQVDRISTPDGPTVKIFEEVGPVGRFQKLTNKHYAELEKELGNEEPEKFFQAEFVVIEEMTAEEMDAEQAREWERRQ